MKFSKLSFITAFIYSTVFFVARTRDLNETFHFSHYAITCANPHSNVTGDCQLITRREKCENADSIAVPKCHTKRMDEVGGSEKEVEISGTVNMNLNCPTMDEFVRVLKVVYQKPQNLDTDVCPINFDCTDVASGMCEQVDCSTTKLEGVETCDQVDELVGNSMRARCLEQVGSCTGFQIPRKVIKDYYNCAKIKGRYADAGEFPNSCKSSEEFNWCLATAVMVTYSCDSE